MIPLLLALSLLATGVFVACRSNVYGFLLLGGNPTQSGNDFKTYLFNVLCALNPSENGVLLRLRNNVREYATDGVHRLRRDELYRALEVLLDLSCQTPPAPGSTSEWSVAAAIAGHVVGMLHVMEGEHSGDGNED